MSSTSPEVPDGDASRSGAADTVLADPLAEGRRVIAAAQADGVVMRALGGVAVYLQSPSEGPLLGREIRDIDLVTRRGAKRAVEAVFRSLGYESDEVFNAFHGASRQIYVDLENRRKVDVFVGSFAMCHAIPIADRLDRDPLTVPLAELLLTKLQIVQLNERDERDIYNLCYHHDVVANGEPGIEAGLVAELCARDWGLWRTCRGTIEHCLGDLGNYELSAEQRGVIEDRLRRLWERIDGAPKSSKWRMRNRVGDRVRWYDEPEEVAGTD